MKILYVICFFLQVTFAFSQSHDTLNFENHYPNSNNSVIVFDSLTGIWQKGTPTKNIFNQAYSGNHAIVTDTLNDYPMNTDSYAYFHVDVDLSKIIGGGENYPALDFTYKLETDSLNDNGYLEFYDIQNSQWSNVGFGSYFSVSSIPYGFIYFDGNYDEPVNLAGNYTYTGNTNGWKRTIYNFTCDSPFQGNNTNRGGSGSINFRFHFHSDGNSESKDGWMIDNLIWQNFTSTCHGGVDDQEHGNFSIYPVISFGTLNFSSENKLFSSIKILDLNGKEIENFSFQPSNFRTLELSNLSNGMYFYSVDDGKAVGKFMIEK